MGHSSGNASAASQGTAPYSYALNAGSLPSGLSLDSTGTLGGTPTASGFFSFTVQATDSYGATGSQSYTLAIAVQPPVANASSATVAANSSANSITLNISGGAASSVAVASQAANGMATASGTSISYTPAAGYSGTDSFSYTASNASGTSAPATVTVTVTAPALLIAPSALPAGTEGQAYSQGLTASQGAAPYSYAVTGSLPTGLSFDPVTGQITGTPTAAGDFSFTLQVTDSHGATGAQSYTLSIRLPVPMANDTSATVQANSQSNAIALNISRAAASSVAVASQASHGTATASGSSISYTPVAGYSGADSFTYTASNASGTSSPATVTVTVTTSTLVIAPSSLPGGTVGATYNQGLAASQGTAPYSYALNAGSLPSGLSLDSTGTLGGTPTASGFFSFTVQATDSYGATGSQSYTLAIAVQPPVANASSATVAANSSANSITLNISGGAASSVAVASQAANGMATASGSSISYTPAAGYSGTDSFSYTASNASGTSAPATVTVTVTAPTLLIAPSALPAGTEGQAYNQGLTASQGAAPYSYAVTGSLPTGLSFDPATGQITGTPTAAGDFSFTLQVTDHHGATGTQSYTLQITSFPAPVASPSSMTVEANSSANPVALSLAGGTANSVTVVVQALHGVATVSGTSISYTPIAGYSGTDAFSYTASNAGGTSAAAVVSITVTAPTLHIAPSTLPSAMVGRAYSQGLTASMGSGPYSYTIVAGSLPDGLTLDPAGGISGTPGRSGVFSLTIQVKDRLGVTATQSYTLDAADPAPVANDVSATVQANSQSNPIALNMTRAVASSVAVVTQALHGTATASGATISYSPAAGYAGTDSFTYTASNTSGTSSPATVTVTVTTSTLVIAPSSLPAGTVGAAYSQSLTASQGTAPYAYALVAGSLPDGLVLEGGGGLRGTPTVGGVFSFTVQVSDSYQATGDQAYGLSIALVTLVANPVSTSVPANSRANAIALNITGSAATSVAVVVQAAHGTATASGTAIDYTPNVGYAGEDVFSYTASNASGTSAAARVTVLVSKPLISAGGGSLPEAAEGKPYSQGIVASGGTAPYSFVVSTGALPAGLELSASGQISGTPKAPAGSFGFSIVVTDAYGASSTVSYTLRVSQAQPVAPALAIALMAGSSVELDLTAAATGKPFTGAAVQSPPPAEAGQASIYSAASAVAQDGPRYLLRFAASPFFSGDVVMAYTLSNTAGSSAPGQINIQVTARTDPSKDADVAGIVAAQLNSAHRFASVQILNFAQRMESLHADGWGGSKFALTLDAGQQTAKGPEDRVLGAAPLAGMRQTSTRKGAGLSASESLGVDALQLPNLPAADGAGGKKMLALWVSGTVKYGREDARNVDSRYRFTTSGISAGADYRMGDLWTLGAGLGLGRDRSDVGENGSQSTADNPLTVLLYTSLRPGRKMFVDGLLGYGRLSFDTTRYISDGSGMAQGMRSGDFRLGSLVAGMEFRQPGWMWSPYARLEVVQVTLDSYSESAAGLAALTYYTQQSSVRNTVLGLRAEGLYALRWGRLMPRIRLEYARNTQRNDAARLAYADLAYLGPAYAISPFSFGSDNWSLGLGARLQTRRGVEFSLELNIGVASGGQSRSMSLGLRLPF